MFLEYHEHKQKIVKAYKKIPFPLKFKIFEIQGFDSTATIYTSFCVKIYLYPFPINILRHTFA